MKIASNVPAALVSTTPTAAAPAPKMADPQALRDFFSQAVKPTSDSGAQISLGELQQAIHIATTDSVTPGVIDPMEQAVIGNAGISNYFTADATKYLNQLVSQGTLMSPDTVQAVTEAQSALQGDFTLPVLDNIQKALSGPAPITADQLNQAVDAGLDGAPPGAKMEDLQKGYLALVWAKVGSTATPEAQSLYTQMAKSGQLMDPVAARAMLVASGMTTSLDG